MLCDSLPLSAITDRERKATIKRVDRKKNLMLASSSVVTC